MKFFSPPILRRLVSKNRSSAQNFCTAASEFVSQKILQRSEICIGASELQKISQEFVHREKLCGGRSTAAELVGRPSLMLTPSFSGVKGGIRKVEYNFYSPLKKYNKDLFYKCFWLRSLEEDVVRKQDIVSLDNSGGQDEVDLIENKHTHCVGSSHGWLVLLTKYYNMCLINPLSGRSIKLPAFRGGEDEEKLSFPVKVILSHSPADEECRALAIHGSFDKVAVCSPGRCERWSTLGLGLGRSYHDFVYSASRKSFVSAKLVSHGWRWLGLNRPTDELEFWDVESRMEAPVKTLRAPPFSLSDPGICWRTFLASEEESGQLYMVRRYYVDETRVDYKVYRINIDEYDDDDDDGSVELCESLDDLVMFIGQNHCFAVKASQFPEYRPNCIYYSGGWFNQHQSADVYNYRNGDYSPLFDLSPHQDFPFDSTLPHWFSLTQD